MLDTVQTETLQALVDTIIPEDDFAGGWEAGVGIYLLRQFEGDLSVHLPLYRQWLDDLNSEATALADAVSRNSPCDQDFASRSD